jgi:hypothetical protein
MRFLEDRFALAAHGTIVRTEALAGFTTFLTMAYIIFFVQPAVLAACGMDFGAVLVATCVSTALATVLMALLANYPIAVAPRWGTTVAGALLGTSTVTAYIESGAGVAAGGRTGLASMFTAALFLASLFLYRLVRMIGGGYAVGQTTLYPVIAPPRGPRFALKPARPFFCGARGVSGWHSARARLSADVVGPWGPDGCVASCYDAMLRRAAWAGAGARSLESQWTFRFTRMRSSGNAARSSGPAASSRCRPRWRTTPVRATWRIKPAETTRCTSS